MAVGGPDQTFQFHLVEGLVEGLVAGLVEFESPTEWSLIRNGICVGARSSPVNGKPDRVRSCFCWMRSYRKSIACMPRYHFAGRRKDEVLKNVRTY